MSNFGSEFIDSELIEKEKALQVKLDEVIAVQKRNLEVEKELKERERQIQDLDFNRIEEEDRIQGEAIEMMRMAEMARKQEDVLVLKMQQFKSR